MDQKFKPVKDEILDYKIGSRKLEKGKEYIANYHWIKHLDCPKEPINVSNYDISIDATDKSILITRAIGLGDILFLTPVLKMIKHVYPTCKIGFATASSQHGLLHFIKEIDEIIDYPIEGDIYNKYDFHFSVSGIVENSEIDKHSNIYYEYLKHLGIKNPDIEDLVPHLSPLEFPDSIDYSPSPEDRPIIGIHPFSGDNMRQLSLVSISFLCSKLIKFGYDILMFSNKIEYDRYHKMFAEDINWSISTNIRKDRTISQKDIFINTINNLKMCKHVICGDSFITHLCQAIGVHCISIYGPFSPNCRVKGYKNITIIDTNPDCRCFKHQIDKCPKDFSPSPCLNIDHDLILDIIEDREIFLDNIGIQTVKVNKYNWGTNG